MIYPLYRWSLEIVLFLLCATTASGDHLPLRGERRLALGEGLLIFASTRR
jgi:hypothetical protein